jgi:hypothetical protein
VAVVGEAAVGDVLVGEEEVERALHRGAPRRAPAEPPRGQEVLLRDRPVVVVREVEVGPVGVELPRRLGVEELGGARDPAAHVGAVGDEPRAQAEPEGLGDEVVVVDGALGVREVASVKCPASQAWRAMSAPRPPVSTPSPSKTRSAKSQALSRSAHSCDDTQWMPRGVGRRAEEGLHLRQERAEERERRRVGERGGARDAARVGEAGGLPR